MQVRINKAIADLGICSRRKAEELILSGQVKLNGKVVRELSTQVDLDIDEIEVGKQNHRKQPHSPQKKESFYYVALHKPLDYVSSVSSQQGHSILELLTYGNATTKRDKDAYKALLGPKSQDKNITLADKIRLYPVGRLDKDSEGLILLTNDGDLTNKMTHPRFEHEKEYELQLDSRLSKQAIKVLEHGMDIGEGEYAKGIRILKESAVGRRYIVHVILQEGKNRQIRRMFGRLGYKVLSLKRTRFGKFKLGTLPVGRWKFIQKKSLL
ncbi:MAG: hypothetical protein COV59_00730 [Candidatus Magasanikbacteria bacterium CG11_big_fil_rev_8_21_14_0_20_39_34]|uniref:Pseudouridine synthase n=1 Tax=Candidatus Magasanikbacteria bacterium CG11_big_fil_rev_8_21_14_0_20_39_34 TaxID=1974653 RepID=A0A2H0N6I3_9BACT|nr:MAG: hypothetical protein COV59_00730 [Candidatus Magasanikbacteria bacterium CG11_big_fil_rev_8_21_14_0_20_39_34]